MYLRPFCSAIALVPVLLLCLRSLLTAIEDLDECVENVLHTRAVGNRDGMIAEPINLGSRSKICVLLAKLIP
jgi:hypothetical protein